MRGAHCDPRPASPPRVIVGGGSKRVLTLAAEQADTVGINTSLASGEKGGDGPAKPPSITTTAVWPGCARRQADRFGSIELQIRGLRRQVVGSRRAAARSATMLGLPGEDALELPIVLIGTVDELCERFWSVARGGVSATSWCRPRRWSRSHLWSPSSRAPRPGRLPAPTPAACPWRKDS